MGGGTTDTNLEDGSSHAGEKVFATNISQALRTSSIKKKHEGELSAKLIIVRVGGLGTLITRGLGDKPPGIRVAQIVGGCVCVYSGL